MDTDSPTGQAAWVLAVEVREATEKALQAIQGIKEDGRFTETHQTKQAREIAVEAVDKVREMVGSLDDLGDELEQERTDLREKTVEPRDPADSAGQLMDQEIRAVLRAMKPKDRAKYLMTKAPADVVEAALRGAPILTGLDPSVHEDLTERAINTRFAKEIEDLENAERNLSAARKARDNAFGLLVEAGGGGALQAAGVSVGDEAA